jgi:diaminopimelate decarboxylase
MSATSAGLSHVFPLGSRVNEHGHLELGGCDALLLAAEFGTPVYVVVEDDLRERARTFLRGLRRLHPDSDVLFGSKAFPCTAVYRTLAEEGLACDVASGGELALALRAGFDPARTYLHGNAKADHEIREAMLAGIGHIVLDSYDDLEAVESAAASLGLVQEVLVRVNPDVSGATHHAMSTGQADSKFGFGLAEAPAAIHRIASAEHLRLVGLHCHIGSQLLELEPFAEAVAALAQLGEFDVYNLGGGLGVAYTSEQEPPSIASYLETIVGAAGRLLGPGKRLLIEPGRALVANSTVTLYTVRTV